ncbi:copper chaperone PCu(A)C [Methylopila sp. M107]|uniref:copper chaperone PCu(A)C n=1 Tax=Methylopila sp. M107 TaxID=1101190 RepID=UPI0003801327|nr:copper chaperone PCu(A)C [Methylopila sp. M107]
MPKLRLLAALPFLLVASGAVAHDYKAGDLAIEHPWSRATTPGAKVGGGFLTVTNGGSAPDRLLAVSAAFAAKVEIHESLEQDGVAKMREIEGGVEIKPGETVAFAPGGKHLMFLGLTQPLAKGEKVKGELTFEKAGKVDVEFVVEAVGARPDPKASHDAHGM